LDAATGVPRWQVRHEEQASTPAPVDSPVGPVWVAGAAARMFALDPATGTLLAALDGIEADELPIATVDVHDGTIYVVSWQILSTYNARDLRQCWEFGCWEVYGEPSWGLLVTPPVLVDGMVVVALGFASGYCHGGLVGLDAATGDEVWLADAWSFDED